MRIANILAAAALLVTGATTASAAPKSGEERLAKILQGRTAGKPVDCIYLPRIRSTHVINGTAIVYDAGHTLYVNRPDRGARQLSNSDILVTRLHTSQLCNVDIVRIVDQGSRFERGFVSLGEFVPYTKVASR